MSIKEALEREGVGSKEQGAQRSLDLRHLSSSYREKVLEAGRIIHRNAGVTDLLHELTEEVIRPNFSDAKIMEETLASNGTIVMGVDWNFRNFVGPSSFDYKYCALRIIAYPLTNELAILGGEELEVLSKSQWSSDPKLLEDAIVNAYRRPMEFDGPPTRL